MTPHTRREFIRLATAAFASLASACGKVASGPAPAPACVGKPRDGWAPASNPRVGLPHLGGAPDTPDGWAIATFVDTVVPGAHRDPTGAPGGIDSGAPGLFFDPALPAAGALFLLVAVLDNAADGVRKGAPFANLTVEQREQALDVALLVPQLEFAVQLAKLAHFASKEAACHLGYPGPNPGYVEDPLFTFGVPLTTELTADGNYP